MKPNAARSCCKRWKISLFLVALSNWRCMLMFPNKVSSAVVSVNDENKPLIFFLPFACSKLNRIDWIRIYLRRWIDLCESKFVSFECAFHVDAADSIWSGSNAHLIQISALVWIRLIFQKWSCTFILGAYKSGHHMKVRKETCCIESYATTFAITDATELFQLPYDCSHNAPQVVDVAIDVPHTVCNTFRQSWASCK